MKHLRAWATIRPHVSKTVPLTTVALLISLVLAAVSPRASFAQDDEFGTREPGTRVYDSAGLLTPSEIAYIDAAAARVEAAGAPTVVFVREADRSGGDTEQDAADLMEAWDIESSPEAKDGLVLFFNSDPDRPRHGTFAFYAGERHLSDNLPRWELQRIISDVMTEPIRNDQFAVGLAAGLDAAAASLTYGPRPQPEPSALERTAGSLATWPMGILGAVVAAVMSAWVWRGWNARPGASVRPATPTTDVPERLPPALAGALVRGTVGGEQAQGTMFDLAARGAISFEPTERGAKKNQKLQILLVDDSLLRTDYEREVWKALESVAQPGGVVTAKDMPKLHGRWKDANDVLRREMEARGWWSPLVWQARKPYLVGGSVASVAAVVALVLSAVGDEPLGVIGVGLLVVAAIVGLGMGFKLPAATTEGAVAAAPWLGLRNGLKAASKSTSPVDYDELLPYILAMNQFGPLQKQLKEASAAGYVPLAFRHSLQSDAWTGGFYPYFIFFAGNSGASSSSSGGVSAGGAASGGGGASGSA